MGQSNSKLNSIILNQLAQDTKFSKKEIQQWYKGFMRDAPSGYLDRAEFRRIYHTFWSLGDSNDFADMVFDQFDLNKNGMIEFNEFITCLSVTARGSTEDKLKWAFDLHDIDKDGYISKSECLKTMQALYKMLGRVKLPEDEQTPELKVQKLFEIMDKDEDEKINYKEFQDGAKIYPGIIQAMNLYDGLV
eukprot:NODE_129_length_16972_cov_2.172643.p12 type:complete len:190 gc:universal NODE_129_length_16972_cov_2.172643:7627-7058(-)